MGFYWAGFIFWFLIVASFLLLILGLWKKSWKVLICSGISLILPSLYFIGGEGSVRLLVLFPLIPFVLANYVNKRYKVNNHTFKEKWQEAMGLNNPLNIILWIILISSILIGIPVILSIFL